MFFSIKNGIGSFVYKYKQPFFDRLNTESNDFRISICLKQSEVYVEGILVCNVLEKLTEHGIYSLPCSNTYDVINMSP